MFENTCDIVKRIVKKWIPREEHSRELGYRDELVVFIRKELERQEKGNMLGLGTPTKHMIKTEAGRANADIEIDKHIGIELKYKLAGKSMLDRLIGQIRHYEDDYDCIIVVLCGDVKEESVEELDYELDQINERSMTLVIDDPKITLVRKDNAVIKKGKKRG